MAESKIEMDFKLLNELNARIYRRDSAVSNANGFSVTGFPKILSSFDFIIFTRYGHYTAKVSIGSDGKIELVNIANLMTNSGSSPLSETHDDNTVWFSQYMWNTFTVIMLSTNISVGYAQLNQISFHTLSPS